MKKVVLCGVISLLLVVITICIMNKDGKTQLHHEQKVTWEEFRSNLDSGKVKFMRNESNHVLLNKCACETFATFPNDIVFCTCQMIEVSCKEHGIKIEIEPRKSCSINCWGEGMNVTYF